LSKSYQKVVKSCQKVVTRPGADYVAPGKKKAGKKHICLTGKSTCKKCKRTGHFDPHCFANWKAPTETGSVSGQGFNDADYASLQVELPSEFSDSESDTSYATAMSAAQGQQQRNWPSKNTPTAEVVLQFRA
jgi:hypothetical protein